MIRPPMDAVERGNLDEIHWVAENVYQGIARVLLEHGASRIILDSHRLTPADRARLQGQKDLITLLETVNGNRKAVMLGSTRSSENHTTDMACVFPKQMHSKSRQVLADYIENQTSTAAFLRLFSLVNSSYLELGKCLVKLR